MLVQKCGEDWKRMRSHATPMFTASKIKTMFPTIDESVEGLKTQLDKYLESQGGGKVPIKLRGYLGLFTIDIITKVAFATDIQAFDKGESHEMIKKISGVIEPPTLKLILLMFTPWKLREFLEFSVFPHDCLDYTLSFIRAVVEQKKREGNRVVGKGKENFLDSFMKAGIFTDEELLANSLMIYGAGYETTRTTLLLCVYFLSFYQEIQEKLYQEMKDLYDKGKFDVDNIMAAEYLEAVINETLRYYPPITRVDRFAMEDVTLNCGIRIPRGGIVRIPIYSIHHQEEYFPDHMDFKPERFLPENRESIKDVFLPFFTGPRNCLGARFALLEARKTIAHLVLRYKFTRPPNDKETYRKLPANATVICPDVVVVVERRESNNNN
jgi:cytochrome P450